MHAGFSESETCSRLVNRNRMDFLAESETRFTAWNLNPDSIIEYPLCLPHPTIHSEAYCGGSKRRRDVRLSVSRWTTRSYGRSWTTHELTTSSPPTSTCLPGVCTNSSIKPAVRHSFNPTNRAFISARCNIYISRLCHVPVHLSVCLWRKCIGAL